MALSWNTAHAALNVRRLPTRGYGYPASHLIFLTTKKGSPRKGLILWRALVGLVRLQLRSQRQLSQELLCLASVDGVANFGPLIMLAVTAGAFLLVAWGATKAVLLLLQ
jgi:hypothetical protein